MMMDTTQQKLEDEDQSNSLYIPSPLIIEILSRLSCIKSIFKCRLVCRSWAEIMSTPDFAKLHLSRSPTTSATCLVRPPDKKTFHLIAVLDSYINDTSITVAPYFSLPRFSHKLTNTCNGLICFIRKYESPKNIYVLNPLHRKEFISIPIPSDDLDVHDSSCVIGFCRLTDQYEIFFCFKYYFSSESAAYAYKAEIYTLGKGLWKNVLVNDPAYIKHGLWNGQDSACIDGVLHWIVSEASSQIICCFDFVTEQFRWVPGPCDLRLGLYGHKVGLWVVNEKLSIHDCSKDHVDIWVMSESWSKHIVISSNIFGKCCIPITVMASGKVLLVSSKARRSRKSKRRIRIYNPKSQKLEYEVEIREICSAELLSTVAYTPSLISVKDVGKGENSVDPCFDITLCFDSV